MKPATSITAYLAALVLAAPALVTPKDWQTTGAPAATVELQIDDYAAASALSFGEFGKATRTLTVASSDLPHTQTFGASAWKKDGGWTSEAPTWTAACELVVTSLPPTQTHMDGGTPEYWFATTPRFTLRTQSPHFSKTSGHGAYVTCSATSAA